MKRKLFLIALLAPFSLWPLSMPSMFNRLSNTAKKYNSAAQNFGKKHSSVIRPVLFGIGGVAVASGIGYLGYKMLGNNDLKMANMYLDLAQKLKRSAPGDSENLKIYTGHIADYMNISVEDAASLVDSGNAISGPSVYLAGIPLLSSVVFNAIAYGLILPFYCK